MFTPGQKVKVIFTQLLPGKEVAPALTHGQAYEVKAVHTDSKGNQHIDVGLKMDVEFIKSFATDEMLPAGIRWCHPNRFVKA
jgi:hypothetical protein